MSETRLLVVGAGSAGRMAVREMGSHPESGYVPVAFIDDDTTLHGTNVEGIEVLGGREAIPEAVKTHRVDEILIALPSVHGGVIRDIVGTCQTLRIRFRIVPGIWEIIRGDVQIEQIRNVEPEDLLGRESIVAESELLKTAYTGKRILVTGAGGSIGRELARQALLQKPEQLVLLGRGENSLFESEVELRAAAEGSKVELALVDIKQPDAVARIFDRIKPHVVLHAAAHKHVTFMEEYPEEAILNNVVATTELVDLCEKVDVERFVMLSTDKAVNPRSVMGASKRVAELVLLDRAAKKTKTRFMAVRFGNVLGSRGSVVPLFLKQIQRGGPVTVSHQDVERYFMTVKEAALLVMHAGALGDGGEIFILDMGDQIKILDLANDLITLSGFRPGVDIDVVVVGLKSGEKLREELVHDFETLGDTSIDKIQVGKTSHEIPSDFGDHIARLSKAAAVADRVEIRKALVDLIPEAELPDEPSGA